MYVYSLTTDDLTRFMNQAREVTIRALHEEGFFTEQQRDAMLGQYAIVVHKRGWFGDMLCKLRNLAGSTQDDKDTLYINLVKIITVPDTDKE